MKQRIAIAELEDTYSGITRTLVLYRIDSGLSWYHHDLLVLVTRVETYSLDSAIDQLEQWAGDGICVRVLYDDATGQVAVGQFADDDRDRQDRCTQRIRPVGVRHG